MSKRYAPKLVFAVVLIAFTIFLVLYNTTLEYPKPADTESGNHYEKAVVTKVLSSTLAPDPDFPDIQIGVQELEMKLLSGENTGKLFLCKNFVERVDNKPAAVGSKMIVSSYDGFVSSMTVSYSRESTMYVLGAIFFLLVIIFGRGKGLKSIFALAFTLICIIFLFVPMLLRGISPVPAAIVVVTLSTVVTLISVGGLNKKTIAAGISCMVCTISAGGMSVVVGTLSRISTYNTPETQDLLFIAQNTSLRLHDILFAGIIIAASGAVMDTAMSIASSISEMKEMNPALERAQLFKSGMNIGKDVMGTMTNTLVLAFAGSGINTLLIIFMYQMPYMRIINLEMLVVEIIRSLTASTAVVLSIPVTAALSARIFGEKPARKGR